MIAKSEVQDVIIIGAGPGGLGCAIEAQKRNLNYLVIEKGCLVNSIYHFPANVTFFSTADLLEIGSVPLIIPGAKPTRLDLLNYYRRIVEHFDLNILSYRKVESIDGEQGNFLVRTGGADHRCSNVVVATGQFDNPSMLKIPGEELDKVSHYYTDAHPFYGKDVAIIGGKNSSVEAALELYRSGARVTLVHRAERFGKSVKYWILPDIENRIKEGKIRALFNTTVERIEEEKILLRTSDGKQFDLPNDFVFALTGYIPDLTFLRNTGIQIDSTGTPAHDSETLETNVPGVFVAGVITAGCRGSKVFIENSRNHGKKIMGHILNGQ